MPSSSKKQHNFMAAIAANPKFAKKVGIPKSVGEEFIKADKGKTFKRGGEMAESKKMVGKEVAFMKKKGAPKSMIKHEESEMATMKKGGKVKCMAKGGKVSHGEHPVQKKGHTKGKQIAMKRGGMCGK